MHIFPRLPECPFCETPEEVWIKDLKEFLFGCYLCGGQFDQKYFFLRGYSCRRALLDQPTVRKEILTCLK